MPHTFFFPEFLFHFARKCAVLCLVAHSWLTLCDPMTAARQTPLSLGFSRKEYWSVLPCPSPGYLPKPGIEPSLPHCRQILYRLSHQNFHEEYERKELSKSLNAWCIFVLPSHSRVQLFVTPWTVARQPPPSIGFSKQEYWGGLPFPSSCSLVGNHFFYLEAFRIFSLPWYW